MSLVMENQSLQNKKDETETNNYKTETNHYKTETNNFKTEFLWQHVVVFVVLHSLAFYGLIYLPKAKLGTLIFQIIIGTVSGIGVTGGAHRLWTHRTYKARLPLRVFLLYAFTMASQEDVYKWARNHRIHHKYSETNADPHNAKRGFFFAHIGWLMCKKHPDVKSKGKDIDMSDLTADPLIRFHIKFYKPLVVLTSFVLPVVFLTSFLGETFHLALFSSVVRLMIMNHLAFLVNSVAHMWGNRPYDKTIGPRENLFVKFFAFGEGFHNYHHTFPWDYAAGEYGLQPNLTTAFIDLMAYFGQAYDLKTVDKKIVKERSQRTGDCSKEM